MRSVASPSAHTSGTIKEARPEGFQSRVLGAVATRQDASDEKERLLPVVVVLPVPVTKLPERVTDGKMAVPAGALDEADNRNTAFIVQQQDTLAGYTAGEKFGFAHSHIQIFEYIFDSYSDHSRLNARGMLNLMNNLRIQEQPYEWQLQRVFKDFAIAAKHLDDSSHSDSEVSLVCVLSPRQ